MSSSHSDPPPIRQPITGRSIDFDAEVSEKDSASGYAAKDISAARWSYRMRAWAATDRQTLVIDRLIVKSTTDDTRLHDAIPVGTVVYGALEWEIVEIDDNTNDTSSPSGRVERRLHAWTQSILAAAITGAS